VTAAEPGRRVDSGEENRVDEQQGDRGARDRVGDPRGGLQDLGYRHADPRQIVEEGGTGMSGPGGAPQEGKTPAERRRRDRD
jgi:hypothetical protein